ncbi:hypothetical protein Tco_0024804 [Tanacetum coccineum]
MSQPPIEPGYFTHLLNFNPQQSNPSTPGSQNSNSFSPYPPFGTQLSPDQAYQSQLSYHQQQPYGFQNFANPRNTPPQYFPQPSQPQYFSPQPSQPQFKDDDDDMAAKRATTRWTRNEDILLVETWMEHSQNANIRKDQHDDVYLNLIMQDFNSRTTAPPRTKNKMGKWTRMHGDCQRFNAIYKHLTRKSVESDADLVENAKTSYMEQYEPIDEDNLQELFGPDPRERPAGKQRALKKRKCDAAERAYKAKREKELGMLQCRELEFLMTDLSSLPPAK